MIRLYPKVVVKAQSFKGVKVCVLPNQSMSLKEILRRFVRKESLPVLREGVYEERFGDLEKISKADIIEQIDYAAALQSDIDKYQKAHKAAVDKAKAASDAVKKAKKVVKAVPPVGGAPINSPPPQGA